MEDIVSTSKVIAENICKYAQDYVESRSTTNLLFTGTITILTILMLKSWLTVLQIKRNSKLKGFFPLPIVGTVYQVFLKKSLTKTHMDAVKHHGKTTIHFEGQIPVIYTADLEFTKAITIKDFHHFKSRRQFGAIAQVQPFKNMITTVKPDEWKKIRSIVTTAFTTGKLKTMSSCILETCNIFTKHLESLIDKNENMDTSIFSNYATDVVCSNFFGVNVDTLNDPEHELPKNIKKVFGGEFTANPKILLTIFAPRIANWLVKANLMTVFNPDVLSYLSELSNQIIEERRSKEVYRNDFIQMMVDHEQSEDSSTETITEYDEEKRAYKNLKKTLTNEEILSQAVLFMMAGADTTSTVLTYVAYNLAMYPKCQNKLIEEIDSVLENHKGEINYDSLSDMSYMSSVITETQRVYTVIQTDRECTEDYEYNGMKIKKGQAIVIQLYAMMHDEEVFPEPYKFIPERERPNDRLVQFGLGPRVCVAQRFAILEIKFLLASILSKFRFEKCDKTIETVTLDNSGLSKPKDSIILKVAKRCKLN